MTMWIWLVVGCGSAEPGHEHGPGTHEHGEEAPAPAPEPAATEAAVAPSPPGARHGGHTAVLGEGAAEVVAADGKLALYVFDAAGTPVAPEGNARVVFTPHGGEEQRLVLAPGEGHWSVDAVASDAGGLAVVQVVVAGRDQTARIAWGESAKHSHDPGEHDHDHGEKGHDHAEHGHDHGEHGHDH